MQAELWHIFLCTHSIIDNFQMLNLISSHQLSCSLSSQYHNISQNVANNTFDFDPRKSDHSFAIASPWIFLVSSWQSRYRHILYWKKSLIVEVLYFHLCSYSIFAYYTLYIILVFKKIRDICSTGKKNYT